MYSRHRLLLSKKIKYLGAIQGHIHGTSHLFYITKYWCIILGNVCGGHCLSEGQDCQCGKETIPFLEATYSKSYCCSDTCSKENGTITCQEGNLKNLNNKCNNSCPFMKFNAMNKLAISTTDCNPEKEHCFDFVGSFNKICSNGSYEYWYEYCSSGGGSTCRPATSKIQFEQCYDYER